MRIGFAGIGRMGAEMARNLADAGFELVLWNRTASKAEALAREIGAQTASTPKALGDEAEIVFTMLADDAASNEAHLGADGLFASKHTKYFIEMGTMSPAHILDLGTKAPPKSLVIDAPVSGSTQAAKAGTLTIMAGAAEQDTAPLTPYFSAMSKDVIALGKLGSGARMKLAVNALIHGINQNFSEAMNTAQACGIAPERAFDVIEASAACPPMLTYRRPLYLDEGSGSVTFTISLAKKDMSIFTALARSCNVRTPLCDVTLKTLERAEAAGFGERDMAAMLKFNQGEYE